MSYASLVSSRRVSTPSFIRSLTCCSLRRSSQSPFETRRSTKGRPLPLWWSPPSLRLPFSPVRRWSPPLTPISSPKRPPLPRKRNLLLQRHKVKGRLGGSRPGLNFARLRCPNRWNGPPHLHLLQPHLAGAHTSRALSPRHLPRRIHQHGMRRRRIRLALTRSFEGSACKRRKKNFTPHRLQPNTID